MLQGLQYIYLILTILTCIGIASAYECSKDRCWENVDRTDASAMLAAGLMATKIIPCLLLVFNIRNKILFDDDKGEYLHGVDLAITLLSIFSIPAAGATSVVGYVSLRACFHGQCWNHVDPEAALAMLVCGQAWDSIGLFALPVVLFVVIETFLGIIDSIVQFFTRWAGKRKVLPVTNDVNV